MTAVYNSYFYDNQEGGSLKSARAIVPLILSYIAPRNIVDIGCGVGTWLSVFREIGLTDCLGVDGSYVDMRKLLIPKEQFLAFDLTQPLCLNRSFDLVLSLEVAEHIPRHFADRFVSSLSALGSVVLFSAAIPFQGGANHINEQWPIFWIQKFEKHGYVVIDCLRRKIWQRTDIDPWYAQNLFFFVRREQLSSYPSLNSEFEVNGGLPIAMVHPEMWNLAHQPLSRRVYRRIFSLLPIRIKGVLKKTYRTSW